MELIEPGELVRAEEHPPVVESAVDCDLHGVEIRVVRGIAGIGKHTLLRNVGAVHQLQRPAIVCRAPRAVGPRVGRGERRRVGADA